MSTQFHSISNPITTSAMTLNYMYSDAKGVKISHSLENYTENVTALIIPDNDYQFIYTDCHETVL